MAQDSRFLRVVTDDVVRLKSTYFDESNCYWGLALVVRVVEYLCIR